MKMVSGKEVPSFTEQQSLRYIRQLVLAIEYCMRKHLVSS